MPTIAVRRARFPLAIALLAACTGALAREAAVLATYAYPKYDRAAALGPLADELGSQLDRAVEVRVYASPHALVAAARAGEVDLAVTNTFAGLALLDAAGMHALAGFDVPADTADRYRGVLLARADGPADAAALARMGRRWRIGEVVPGSTSGALVQELHLRALGVRVETGSRRYAGTHEGALALLRAGDVAVAALADAAWRDALAREPTLAGALRELWRSPPITPGPLVCRSGGRLPCAAAQRVLLDLHRTAPAALSALAGAWSEAAGATRLVAVDATAYAGVAAGFSSPAARAAALQQLLRE